MEPQSPQSSQSPLSSLSIGRAVRCQRCHGSFELTQLTAWAQCPYCGHQQRLESQTINDVRAYQADVEGQLARANQSYQHAAAWQRWGGQGSRAGLAVVALFAVIWLGPLILGGLHKAFGLDAGALMPLLPVLAIGGYMAWFYGRRRKRARTARVGTDTLACPSCDAPNTIGVGQAVQTCAYCHSALMPSHTVMMRALDAARLARRHASMEFYRQERKGKLAGKSYSAVNTWLPYFWVLASIPIMGVMAMYQTGKMIAGTEPFDPMIAGAGIGTAVLAVIVATLWMLRRQRAAAWRATVADLARQFHGAPLARARDAVGWLDRYWAGPSDAQHLAWSGLAVAAAIDACGYPALIDIDPARPTDTRARRVRVMLAAWVPGGDAGNADQPIQIPAAASERARHLREIGFEPTLGEAGLIIDATPRLVRYLRKTPGAAHGLAHAIVTAAGLLADAGADSVPPDM